jgi:hypothetical protein
MNARVLIDAILQQSTVLVAQIATSGGLRAPLAHIANEVFLDLARALEAEGVSRKVGADMFGMALRAYIRKVQRLEESTTDQGRSLWNAVYHFLQESGLVTRDEVVRRCDVNGSHTCVPRPSKGSCIDVNRVNTCDPFTSYCDAGTCKPWLPEGSPCTFPTSNGLDPCGRWSSCQGGVCTSTLAPAWTPK